MDADSPQKTVVAEFPKVEVAGSSPVPRSTKIKVHVPKERSRKTGRWEKVEVVFPRFFPRLAEFDFSHGAKYLIPEIPGPLNGPYWPPVSAPVTGALALSDDVVEDFGQLLRARRHGAKSILGFLRSVGRHVMNV